MSFRWSGSRVVPCPVAGVIPVSLLCLRFPLKWIKPSMTGVVCVLMSNHVAAATRVVAPI